MDRTTIYHGPAIGGWDSETLHFEGDVTVKVTPDLFEVMTSGFGRVARRRRDLQIEITGKLSMWPGTPGKLLPYASHNIGQSIYGGTDKPFVLTPRNGGNNSGWTIANAAITGLGSLICTADKTLWNGNTTWTGILANNGDPADLADYIATSNAGALTGFDLTKMPTGKYTGSWGDVIEDFFPEEGFVITPRLTTEDVWLPGLGCVDKIVTGLEATCAVVPVGISAADILTILGSVDMGEDQAQNDLVITGGRAGMPVITLKNTNVNFSTGRAGAAVKRIGEVEFETVRTQADGLLQPLWTFGTVAAP